MAADDMAEVIADDVMDDDVMAADDAADDEEAEGVELLAADPELLLLQAARVKAAVAVMTVATTRVLAFMGASP